MKKIMTKYRWFLIVVILISIIFYGVGYYLNNKLNSFVINLSDKISKQIGHPVKIAKVTNNWDWLYLKINISDLIISDKETNIPLFMASSIVGTVDAVESVLGLDLKFKHMLLRNPRLVLNWDGKGAPLILGLGGENIPGHIDPKILLRLLTMQGKVNIENGDFHLQGMGNADLPFMDVKLDFVEKAKNEYSLIARGSIAAAVPPEFNLAMNYAGDLKDFTKSMIDFELKTSNIKVKEILSFIPKFKQDFISGDFKDLDFKGTIQNGSWRNIRSNFSIGALVLNNDTIISSGEGKLEVKPLKDRYSLSLTNFKIANEKIFSYPLNIDSVKGDIIANNMADENKWNISAETLDIKLLDMKLKAGLKMQVENNKISDFEIHSSLEDGFIEKALVLLPDNLMHNDLHQWLNKSLIDGLIERFMFKHKDSKNVASLSVKQAELQYSPDWPSVHGIDADIIFDVDIVRIESNKAAILNKKVDAVIAKFPMPFDGKKASIIIDGNMSTTLEAGLDFLQQSPLKNDVGDRIKEFAPSGPIHLSLNLNIGLKDEECKVTVNGNIDLLKDSLVISNVDLPLNNIVGNLNFTNKTLQSNNLELELFARKATAKISLQEEKHNGLQISVATPIYIDDLKQSFKSISFDKLSGNTNIIANLSMPWNFNTDQKVLTITSDLDGVAINYPEPLRKAANTKMPSQLKYFMNSDRNDSLYLKLGKLLDTNFSINNGAIQGGHIAFGTGNAVLANDSGLVVSGKIDKLNSDVWQDWLGENKSFKNMSVDLELLVDKLYFNKQKFNSMWVKYESKTDKWSLENALIKGTINFIDDDKIDVRLDNLELDSSQFKNNEFLNYVEQKRKDGNLPLIQFYCEQLLVNKKDYRKISFQLLPRVYGYEITEFSISNENILVQAQGQWQMQGKEFTQLSGNAYTKNLGKALDNWGYNNSVTRGDGEVNFSIQWPGNPANFDIMNLEGSSHVDLRSGNLTGVNPGLGRVVGLLSLESIQRRLKLDFSDVLSKGFSFDKLSSDLKLNPGLASSENILINGPSARIELSGKTDLKSHNLDFIMFVTPKVGAGLPIAAAIAAGNPAVGAAIWLFDKASGSKISEISRYKYKVSGTWNAPNIEEIKVKTERKESKDDNESREQ